MKKASSIVFGSFYLLLSLGIHIQGHYCMGKLKSLDHVLAESPSCCGEESDCCEQELFSLELSDEQLVYASNIEFPVFFVAESLYSIENQELSKKPLGLVLNNGPPPNLPPSYLLNCSFVFYG